MIPNLSEKIKSTQDYLNKKQENFIIEERENFINHFNKNASCTDPLKNQINKSVVCSDPIIKKDKHYEIFNILNKRKLTFYDMEQIYLNKELH